MLLFLSEHCWGIITCVTVSHSLSDGSTVAFGYNLVYRLLGAGCMPSCNDWFLQELAHWLLPGAFASQGVFLIMMLLLQCEHMTPADTQQNLRRIRTCNSKSYLS